MVRCGYRAGVARKRRRLVVGRAGTSSPKQRQLQQSRQRHRNRSESRTPRRPGRERDFHPEQASAIAAKAAELGLVWGGSWTDIPDEPHIELAHL
ncbi:M15 family metallopeptidase [Gordonia sp. YC-JH1]|uniref:M15 family metallopeptidase n=1 Tax=Gordonia sp. YC-JH1 TaxID=2059875 RepID=UPI001F20678E|nr:M15 family metallopeptidase [Gordonia sp. YC-JH1]